MRGGDAVEYSALLFSSLSFCDIIWKIALENLQRLDERSLCKGKARMAAPDTPRLHHRTRTRVAKKGRQILQADAKLFKVV